MITVTRMSAWTGRRSRSIELIVFCVVVSERRDYRDEDELVDWEEEQKY